LELLQEIQTTARNRTSIRTKFETTGAGAGLKMTLRLEEVGYDSAARAALRKLICKPAPEFQDETKKVVFTIVHEKAGTRNCGRRFSAPQ
jgi:hypothetical protein